MPEPDNTAVRVALWRALHAQLDPPPHVLEDEIGLRLAAPAEGWQRRPDMDPERTKSFRASIVARARFIEDLVEEQSRAGVAQYILLGAGLDTFAERRTEVASRLNVFEVDQRDPQEWKRHRLIDLGYGIPEWLHLVSVDFEKQSWLKRIAEEGFDSKRPAVVASTGVSMYLTKTAVEAMLREVASLASGSTLAMSFLLPFDRVDPELRPAMEGAAKGARASGTPWLSFFTPDEILALARQAGFRHAEHISAAALAGRYFAGRTDGLRPPDNAEELLVART